MTTRAYRFEALSAVWTGDIDGKSDRLVPTGLLGSIRWWFEVVARGLGGYPCDPSNTKCIDRKHCVVCELFGCTGWARKFRFDVLDEAGVPKQAQIKRSDAFTLRLTPLRPVSLQEWALLELTVRLIAEHAALGGKTPFKPTDEQGRRDQRHHQDYGLVRLASGAPAVPPTDSSALSAYVGDGRWRPAPQDGMAWASLANFWSVPGRYLARKDANNSAFNAVIGRDESKGEAGNGDSWLAGRRARSRQDNRPAVEAESKKVFSFRDPARTYGFVNPRGSEQEHVTIDTIKQSLEQGWGSTVVLDIDGEATGGISLRTGPRLLESLLASEVT